MFVRALTCRALVRAIIRMCSHVLGKITVAFEGFLAFIAFKWAKWRMVTKMVFESTSAREGAGTVLVVALERFGVVVLAEMHGQVTSLKETLVTEGAYVRTLTCV